MRDSLRIPVLGYLSEVVICYECLSIFGAHVENNCDEIDDNQQENEDEKDVLDDFYFISFELVFV